MKAFRLALPYMLIPLIVGCPAPDTGNEKGTELNPYIGTFNVLNEQMAERVRLQLGDTTDFKPVVSIVDFKIGTLIRVDNSVAINYDSCQPDKQPEARRLPSMFPSYMLSSDAAAGMGLEEGVISKLISAGAELSGNEKVVFSVKDAVLQSLSDDELETIIKKPKCKEAIAKRSAFFVRGYVQGQRDFQISKAKKIGGNLSISKVGKFSVNFDGNKSITLTDLKAESLVMIISNVSVAEGSKISRFEYPVELKEVSKITVDKENLDAEKNTKVLMLSPGTGTSKIIIPDN
ncbi:hypothetical protein AWY96_03670 [Serratia plymuthica]|uniref:hypothetical protein n=1 Tax=Serratia plymuthica TaxID=82996 RepID=UPI0007A0C082|nr:hypothetical protein [Serratia plymuthica]KYQ97646.1 hypothetical protein AWY96_03670 [Serratia plymuthica]